MQEPLNAPVEPRDARSDTWPATDGLGRALPGFAECGPTRAGRFVGMFYFVWLGWHDTDLHDISKLLLENPDDPPYGPVGRFHWWGEPRLGYYRSDDRYVIREHARMLTDAGIDVIFLDVTNAVTYDPTVRALCEEYRELRALGQPTPQIAFLTNSGSADVVRRLYESFYSANLFPELWFRWKGKPFLLSSQDGITDPTILDFFTWRRSWAWTEGQEWFGDGQDRWPWLDHYPQNPGWHEAPDRPEQISVCVAQHPVSDIGRSFSGGVQPSPEDERPFEGRCFQEQWDRALAVDPEFVLVTGWNEWVAQRFLKEANDDPPQAMARKPLQPGDSFFVDQYSLEFSRDIEPMRGGYGDAYYYQLVANIRRYKGVRPSPPASPPKTIPIDAAGFAAWDTVEPTYLDSVGDTAHRDHPGWGGLRYESRRGRNDLDRMKVARDSTNLYFFLQTRAALDLPNAGNGLLLLLDITGIVRESEENHFDFVVRVHEQSATLHQSDGAGFAAAPLLDLAVTHAGNRLHLAIPRAALGLPSNDDALRFEFKWADNAAESEAGPTLDDAGDVAPNGRFRYVYGCFA